MSESTGTLVQRAGQTWILTAEHVGSRLNVYDRDTGLSLGRTSGRLVSGDVALIPWDRDPGELRPVALRWGRPPDIGDRVYWTAHPMGMERTVTYGYVADDDWKGRIVVHGLALPGSSGAAVFDRSGAVVGVVSSVADTVFGLQEDIVIVEPIHNLSKKAIRYSARRRRKEQ